MKKAILSVILGISALALSMQNVFATGFDDPLPNAYCYDGHIKIYIYPKDKPGISYIRIDNLANSWNPQSTTSGDYVIDMYTRTYYQRDLIVGNIYGWWVHTVDSFGNLKEAKGGTLYCRAGQPQGLTNSYSDGSIVLKWQPVKGVTRYAIRVDNMVNPWTPEAMQSGDHILNNLTNTSFTFRASPGRKITWWIHAVDKNGQYSTAAVQTFTTPQ